MFITNPRPRWLTQIIIPILVTSALTIFSATSKASDFRINGNTSGPGPITLTVAADGNVYFELEGDPGTDYHDVEIQLHDFREEEKGMPAELFFKSAEDTERKPVRLQAVTFNEQKTILLDGTRLTPGKKYRGRISIAQPSKPEQNFTLEIVNASPVVYQGARDKANAIVISAPPSGIASFLFDAGASHYNGQKATFQLAQFSSSKDGSVADVYFHDDDDPQNKPVSIELTIQDRISIEVDATQLEIDTDYLGELFVSLGDIPLSPIPLKIKRYNIKQTAELIVGSPQPVELTCWRWRCTPHAIEVELSESSGNQPIRGIFLTTVSEPPIEGQLDVIKDLEIEFLKPVSSLDGVRPQQCYKTSPERRKAQNNLLNLWRIDAQNDVEIANRSLSANSQGTLCIRFNKTLLPGDYKIPIGVRALNANTSELEPLVLTLKVKHPELYPVAMLIISVLISYILTKSIRTQLQRIDLKKRISRIKQNAWLNNVSNITPVVRIEASLTKVARAIDYSRFTKYLFFPDSLKSEVTLIENRLPILESLCREIHYWQNSKQNELIQKRALKNLRQITDELVRKQLDQDVDPKTITSLANMTEWRNFAKLTAHYWLSLQQDIYNLSTTVKSRFDDFAQVDTSHNLSTLKKLNKDLDDTEALNKALAGLRDIQQATSFSNFPELLVRVDLAVPALENIVKFDNAATANCFIEIESRLKAVSDRGPQPVRNKVESLLKAIRSSGLKKQWAVIEDLKTELARSVTSSDNARIELEALLENIECWNAITHFNFLTGLDDLLTEIENSEREIIRDLRKQLKPDEQPQDLDEAIDRENIYARLKVINEAPEALRDDLIELEKQNKGLNAMFKVVDDNAWEKMDSVTVNAKYRGKSACELIEFYVDPNDRELESTYLFKNGSKYEWTIEYEPVDSGLLGGLSSKPAKGGGNNESSNPKLTVTTDSPSVAQFVPVHAHVKSINVAISYREKKPIVKDRIVKFEIGKARVFNAVAAFQRIELTALLIALVAAITTGMQSQQFEDALSGTFVAYWMLFAWGFATDQVKNVFENIEKVTGTAKSS